MAGQLSDARRQVVEDVAKSDKRDRGASEAQRVHSRSHEDLHVESNGQHQDVDGVGDGALGVDEQVDELFAVPSPEATRKGDWRE